MLSSLTPGSRPSLSHSIETQFWASSRLTQAQEVAWFDGHYNEKCTAMFKCHTHIHTHTQAFSGCTSNCVELVLPVRRLLPSLLECLACEVKWSDPGAPEKQSLRTGGHRGNSYLRASGRWSGQCRPEPCPNPQTTLQGAWPD
jgi:hypothetical protein